jgi:hypothetical protein
MSKKKLDPEEYEIKKTEKPLVQVLKEMLEGFIGKEIVIKSNIERFKGDNQRIITVYKISQEFNELGQVIVLENPNVSQEKVSIPIWSNMELSKEGERIILKYPKQLSFRALRRQILPDLEIYIEEKK